MAVSDHCSCNLITASPGESVRAVAQRMAEGGVGYLVVVDAGGRPVGVVSDRDVVLRALRRRRDLDTTPVDEVMDDEVISLRDDASLVQAFRRLRSEGLRRLPVVDDTGRVIGVFAADDGLRLLAEQIASLAAVAESQRARGAAREVAS